jgi:hypothetical protein
MIDLRTRVLLSVQRALLGEITPEMRAVEVEWSPECILLRVFTEGEANDKLQEEFDASAVTQIVADFPEPDRNDPRVEFDFIRCDAPARIPVRGVLVFCRAGVGADAAAPAG